MEGKKMHQKKKSLKIFRINIFSFQQSELQAYQEERNMLFFKAACTAILLAIFFLTVSCATDTTKLLPEPDIKSYPVNVNPLKLGANEKQVSLILVDNNAPVQNAEVALCYYDEVSMTPVLKKAKTDENGISSFIVPGRDDGASYIFRFGLHEADLSNTTAIRIPSKNNYGGQQLIILVFNKNMLVTNNKAAIQLIWFPNAGEKIPSGGDILTGKSTFRLR
jgi:hypothetical protein